MLPLEQKVEPAQIFTEPQSSQENIFRAQGGPPQQRQGGGVSADASHRHQSLLVLQLLPRPLPTLQPLLPLH